MTAHSQRESIEELAACVFQSGNTGRTTPKALPERKKRRLESLLAAVTESLQQKDIEEADINNAIFLRISATFRMRGYDLAEIDRQYDLIVQRHPILHYRNYFSEYNAESN